MLKKESIKEKSLQGQSERSELTKSTSSKMSVSTLIEISESELLARKIATISYVKKAYDALVIDVRKVTDMTDFFVICSVDSDRQAKAVSDEILDQLREDGEKPTHTEVSEHTWIVHDYFDVILHIFVKSKREFYNLERLWGDGEFHRINEDGTEMEQVEKVVKPKMIKPKKDKVKKDKAKTKSQDRKNVSEKNSRSKKSEKKSISKRSSSTSASKGKKIGTKKRV